MNISAREIIDFWFSDRVKRQWFSATSELDQEILTKYKAAWEKASSGGLDDWVNDSDGCLALVIILDQFPLHMFREQAKSFESENKAIGIALKAIDGHIDRKIDKEKLAFLYMPLMHSEELTHQDMSVKLFSENKLHNSVKFAEHHRELIRRFGRFPHRNRILGRDSTDEEMAYLQSENAFRG